MNKSIKLVQEHFESSSTRTPQYLTCHRTFGRELKKLLAPHAVDVLVSKPNHFDITGFFTLNDGRIFYFSVGDLRWFKDQMLIRTAKHYKDYTGGVNQYIRLDRDFADNLLKFIA